MFCKVIISEGPVGKTGVYVSLRSMMKLKLSIALWIAMLSTALWAETVMMKPLRLKGEAYETEAPKLERLFAGPLPQILEDNNRHHDLNLHLTVLSEEETQELFILMANKKTIPFKYDEDGCYARAHRMARIAQFHHIQVGKVFLFGELRPRQDLGWTYHVAPVVAVKVGKDILLKVIDPSLHSTPVLVHEWVKRNHAFYTKDPFVLTFTNRYDYGPEDIGENHRFFSVSDLVNTSSTLRKYRKKLKKEEYGVKL